MVRACRHARAPSCGFRRISRAWHDNPTAREDDAERQELLERHGERVLRVTWKQAVMRPAETLVRVRAAIG
jgi:very-short-patch-repair endonuclease